MLGSSIQVAVGLEDIIRTATLVVAASDASTASKRFADYLCDGTADDVQIQAAIDAINATGVRGTLVLSEGTFTCAATIAWKSNVDLRGNWATLNVSPDAQGALDFDDLTNVQIRDVIVRSVGAGGTIDSALSVRGTTDDTVEFINVHCYLDATASTDAVIWVWETASPRLINVKAIGHAGNVNGVRGLYTGDGAGVYIFGGEYRAGTGAGNTKIGINIDGVGTTTIIDVHAVGGSGATDTARGGYIATNGITDGNYSTPITIMGGIWEGGIANRSQGLIIGRRSIVNGQGGIFRGGTGSGTTREGMAWEDNATGTWNGGECFGGLSDSAAADGLSISGSASPILKNMIVHGNELIANSRGVLIAGNVTPEFSNLLVTPTRHSYLWSYDDANNGRFAPLTPVLTHPYQVIAINVDVVNAYVGETVDIGSTVSGTEIASGISIASTGVKYFGFTKKEIVADAYLYVTPSVGINDGDVKVEFIVCTNYGGGYAWYHNGNGDTTRLTNSVLQSNQASDTFRVQNTSPLGWAVIDTLIETFGTARSAIQASGAVASLPFFNCKLLRNYTTPLILTIASGTANVTSFSSLSEGTATVTDGNTNVTVTHNLGSTPIAHEIMLTPTNNLGGASHYFIDAIGATTFRINVNIDPGATTATFAWRITRGTP